VIGLSALSPGAPVFDAEPLLVGALGSIEPTLFASIPELDLSVRIQGSGYLLLAGRPLQHWQGASAEGWYWRPIDRSVAPASLADVQSKAMAAGLMIDRGGRVTLHNDMLGIQPLFVLHRGGAVYFSNWLPILVRLARARTPDPTAWASTLILGFVLPGRSHFSEIRSLDPCSSISVSNGVVESTTGAIAVPPMSQDESIVRAVRRALPQDVESCAFALSGGWDSRLLVALSAGSPVSRRLASWTTSTDDGIDLDLEFARLVANHLGTRHHEVIPRPESWPESISAALARFHHSTWMHGWLEPLAATLRARGTPVVDGLGGDVLFKGLLQDPEDDLAGQSRAARRRLLERLGGWHVTRTDAWSSQAVELFSDVIFDDFERAIMPVTEGPTWQMLVLLTTRTARAISLAPLRLFGPELDLYFPFISLPVLASAFDSRVRRHRGSDFYRKLIASVDPSLEGIPSTNDPHLARERSQKRRIEHPAALLHLADVIEQSSALRLLAPELRRAIEEKDVTTLAGAMKWTSTTRALQGVYAYASWLVANPFVDGSDLIG
jgi:hypothetical protein